MASALEFPILRLPDLVIEYVLSNLHCADLVDFSFCSKKCKRAVTNLKTSKYNKICMYFNKNMQYLQVMDDYKERIQSWRVCPIIRFGLVSVELCGTRLNYMRAYNGSCIIYATSEPGRYLKVIVDHLKSIFNINNIYVDFRPKGLKDAMNYVQVFPECQTFYLIGTESISPKDLEFIRENVKANYFNHAISPTD